MEQTVVQEGITLVNGDCMEYMRGLPDGAFELSVCDPPYGIGEDGAKNHTRGKIATAKDYKPYSGNDILPPPMEYFVELKRVSRNQIIFGANHFIENIPNANSSCWIVWDKDNGATDFADCELAWTSFKTAVRKFKWRWQGMLQEDMANKQNRIHPNEKPIALYKWILQRYAKQGDRILDTHLGSGSSAIAAWELGFSFTGIEIDDEYYNKAVERFKRHTAQGKLF